MPRRSITFLPGHYYHIYNRGCGRLSIFREEENYHYLLRLMKSYASELMIAVIAYCLMPNHYHFLLRQDGGTSAGLFPQRIFNRYTKACNRRYQRSGTLFEGPYRARHIEEDAHLLHLCRYIHANPVVAGLVDDVDGWPYSNYLEWVGLRDGTLVDRDFVAGHFTSLEDYRRFVLEYCQGKVELPDTVRAYLLDLSV